MSYQVGAALCNDRDQALTEIVANWLYGGGINSTDEVADMKVDDVVAEMKDMDCEYQSAPMPPQYDDEGERVYEDLEPTEDELVSIIQTAIDDARAAA